MIKLLTRTEEDLKYAEERAIRTARVSFWHYRHYIHHGRLKDGWFVWDICQQLQQFYEDLIDGKRPKLAIEAPPQHGKSTAIIDFVTWLSGKHPEKRVIYTSFSERLGVRANLACQRIIDSKKYKKIFPATKISTIGNRDLFGATRNRELLEYIDEEGYFRNTTVRGSITGESLDLGIVDDPLRGRADANSETVRDNTWEWMTDDFMTRFSEDAGLLVIATRWHIDDPIARLRLNSPDMRVVTYKAIADVDETYRKAGTPLFPAIKSFDFLENIRKTMVSTSWMSLYQQAPFLAGGNIIHGEWFKYYSVLPPMAYRMIYADTAMKTKEANDYSVFQCWGQGREDGRIYLIDQIRGKWEAPELERRATAFWQKHKAPEEVFAERKRGALRSMKVEDKASGTGLIQGIKAKGIIPILPIERVIDKYTRVLDGVGYIEAGYVVLPSDAPWVSDFVEECEAFTADDSHMFDDQIDPMMDAIKDMVSVVGYDIQALL